MTSLPPNAPDRIENIPRLAEAYNVCLELERSLQSTAEKGGHIGNDLVYIRILGYLLHLVPGEQGLKTVVEEINSCIEDSALIAFGQMYYDHYIKALRKNRGIEPKFSNDMPRTAFETMEDMINDTLLTAPQSDETAKTMALIRDGHRCVITGKYEESSVEKIRELEEKILADYSLRVGSTDCAHIFAPSAGGSGHMGPCKNHYSAVFWEIMDRFGYETLPDDLGNSKIHRLENVMTTCLAFRDFFDNLYIWLAATKEENKYMLRALKPFVLRGIPEYVMFTTPDPARFPVPSPTYLAIHAACAEIAYLSGAVECIDKHYRDMREKTTLDSDGASAELLAEAIRKIQILASETDARVTQG